MATGSLLALLDDITTILDDVSVMTKIAAKKTAGVLGDDLALNAQQVTGVNAERELPVVWAVAKGSFVNKLILVPAALAISYFAPWLITPLLMIGGAYLCFEGVEKIAHKFLHSPTEIEAHEVALDNALEDHQIDMVAFEKDKIKGAVRTDFVLSAEIIVIALGTVATEAFSRQVMVVSLIAVIMTIGVYGLVAGIVKLDDLGLHLMLKKGASFFAQLSRKIGEKILAFAPFLMRTLSVVGTAAMFLVGGGILVHGLPFLHHGVEQMTESAGGITAGIISQSANALVGVLAGALVLLVLMLFKKLK
ncbi:MAG: DUF808 domain-containing protein [Methylophilaceae bacterium]